MILLFWIYATLRLFIHSYKGNFLLVKKFEIEDTHQEIEMIIDMLQNQGNPDYVNNVLENSEEKIMEDDYDN